MGKGTTEPTGRPTLALPPSRLARAARRTDHILPRERVHWVSLSSSQRNSLLYPNERRGGQTSDLRWFELDGLADNITLTTSNAIELLDAHLPESG